MKLEIDLVPSTVWHSSLYKLLPRKVWNNIRNEIVQRSGRKCQICGETEGLMNLHEIWKYDDRKHIQKLKGFILLCRMCHYVKHIGLAGILASQGKLDYDEVVEHFCKVNKCTKREFEEHKARAFEIWEKRSKHQWKQDFGKYEKFIKQDTQRRSKEGSYFGSPIVEEQLLLFSSSIHLSSIRSNSPFSHLLTHS